jgi:hypothetical protein
MTNSGFLRCTGVGTTLADGFREYNATSVGSAPHLNPLPQPEPASRRLADSRVADASPEPVDRATCPLYAEMRGRDRLLAAERDRYMSGFDKREEGFEKKYAHDEELRFKAMARRNKLLGQWAADKLGIIGADADAYAKAVVIADFDEPGDDDVFRKVRADFDAKGVKISDEEIHAAMNDLLAKAVEEIEAGT